MEKGKSVCTDKEEQKMNLITVGSGSTGNCYLLESDGEVLILDAGVPIKEIKRALGWNILGIKGAICTHHHKDHSKYIHDFDMMGVRTLVPHEHECNSAGCTFGNFIVEMFAIKNKDGQWVHTNADGSECPIYGALIRVNDKNILYATDIRSMPYRLRDFHLHTIIIGCNYEGDAEYENAAKEYHVWNGHASLETVKGILKANQTDALRNVVLCHLSSSADAERIRREVQDVVGENVTVNIAEKETIIQLI